MMFTCKVKKESKLFTGFPTLHMRLPSLCMQALGLGYSTVWANRAGGQSTAQALVKTSPQGGTAFPVKRKTLLNLLYSISLDSIIQGWPAMTRRCEASGAGMAASHPLPQSAGFASNVSRDVRFNHY